jgi:hypothetical protein
MVKKYVQVIRLEYTKGITDVTPWHLHRCWAIHPLIMRKGSTSEVNQLIWEGAVCTFEYTILDELFGFGALL